MEEAKILVDEIIDQESQVFDQLSRDIWNHPETNYQETYSHQTLVCALENFGFCVQKNFILPTAFRAEFGKGKGPTVAILCEYDALPEIGHACGHNLIAEAGVAAGVGIKRVLENGDNFQGKVVILGTPAEEGGGGKIELLEAGAFKDIEAVLMVHPSPSDYLYPSFISVVKLEVNYSGKAAHAFGYPWEGFNALDAAVACYNNVALLRKHTKPNCVIHGIISKGGVAPIIIPDQTQLKFFIGANDSQQLEEIKKRVESCCLAAAQATGCRVDLTFHTDVQYHNLVSNKCLAMTYEKYARQMGVKFSDHDPHSLPFLAASDVGNVSHVVPSIQPLYSIGTSEPNHSLAFTRASGSSEAQPPTLLAAKSLALTALEIFLDEKLLSRIKEQFIEDSATNFATAKC